MKQNVDPDVWQRPTSHSGDMYLVPFEHANRDQCSFACCLCLRTHGHFRQTAFVSLNLFVFSVHKIAITKSLPQDTRRKQSSFLYLFAMLFPIFFVLYWALVRENIHIPTQYIIGPALMFVLLCDLKFAIYQHYVDLSFITSWSLFCFMMVDTASYGAKLRTHEWEVIRSQQWVVIHVGKCHWQPLAVKTSS